MPLLFFIGYPGHGALYKPFVPLGAGGHHDVLSRKKEGNKEQVIDRKDN